jgi:hypothetical protein
MNNKFMYIIIIVLIIGIYCTKEFSNLNEQFYDLTPLGPRCGNCYYKSPDDCMACANCGVCGIGSLAKCVPGDINGPFYTDECNTWLYTDHKEGKINKEKTTISSRPWNWFYPHMNLTRYPSPVFRSIL